MISSRREISREGVMVHTEALGKIRPVCRKTRPCPSETSRTGGYFHRLA
jgi:hypothetical protein